MLEIKSINKSFREDFWKPSKKVLSNLNFSINENEVVGFVGSNGSGKTTTIKIILGLIKSDSGHVIFSEKLGKNKQEIFQQIGYLPEIPRFFENLTGNQVVFYLSNLYGMNKIEINDKLKNMADDLSLEFALDRKIGTYSKGMKQRIGFIIATIHSPKLLVLDEPLSGLDPEGRFIFKNKIRELHKNGTSILMTSHILEDLYEVGTKFIMLKDGSVAKIKTNFELQEQSTYILKIKKHQLNSQKIDYCQIEYFDDFDVLTFKFQDRAKILGDLDIKWENVISYNNELGNIREFFK